MRASVLWLLLLIAGCSGKHPSSSPSEPSSHELDGGARDAAEDAGVGWTMRAAYRCCLEGDGTSCCEGTSPNTCYPYGGMRGECVVAGDEFDGKEICVDCCPGLQRSAPCPRGTPSALVCINCGDGVCGPGEGDCNCPRDCPPPVPPPGTPIPN